MTIDGLTLNACVNELKQKIIGAKIDKVYQPLKNEVSLGLRTKTANLRLVISISAGDCRIGITKYPNPNPQKPPTFCMFLRKHLQSARITSITQVGLERIVRINLEGKDELGIAKKQTLICELMGKYSNVILIDENDKILNSAKHVPFGMSRVRQVLPGLLYETPPSDKYNPFLLTKNTFLELTANIGAKPMTKFLVQRFQGVSNQTADELIHRYLTAPFADMSRGDRLRFIESVLTFFKDLQNGKLPPTIGYDDTGTPKFFSVYTPTALHFERTEVFKSPNDMIDTYYHAKTITINYNRKRHTLEKLINKALTKLYKKLRIQDDALAGAQKAERFKLYGDMIVANIYMLKRGMDKVHLTDYNTGEPLEIVLDKKLTPSANAQKFYKRYNKLKKAAVINAKYIEHTRTEINFLESVSVSLLTCEETEELSEVRYELIKAGYINEKSGVKRAKPTQASSKPHAFTSSDDFTIFAGKNNRQNDLLTIKTALPDDIWLHTKKIPGSHIIIKTNGKTVPDQTLFEAASLAAYYSKAKVSTKVPVDYTPRKYVKKPNGSKPGFVIYETYQTIIVNPSEAMTKTLKKR